MIRHTRCLMPVGFAFLCLLLLLAEEMKDLTNIGGHSSGAPRLLSIGQKVLSPVFFQV